MDPLTYIKTKLKSTLEKSTFVSPDLDGVVEELLPSILLVISTDHTDTLASIQNEVATLSDEALTEHVQMKRILNDSVEKVASLYDQNYTEISLDSTAKTIISNDLGTLLKQDPSFWERAREKTYQEVMNDARPGSNDERVYLWLGEIKRNTGIAPETNETVGEYSVRAIANFLRSQAGV